VRGGRSLRRGRVLGTLRTKSGSAFGDSTLKEIGTPLSTLRAVGTRPLRGEILS
jgi:hypothetical protein